MAMILGIDFDGTCVTHEFPEIGRSIGAERVLKRLVDAGHKLILFTVRDAEYLQHSVEWFKAKEIELFGINENPQQKSWSQSPKPFAHLYIDDMALGAPLVIPENGERPYIDWTIVEVILTRAGILHEQTAAS